MIQTHAGSQPALSHAQIRSVITGLMLAIFLGALEQTIIAVALPKLSADLKGFELLAWVVSGYLVAMAVATPIYGKLGDLYGRRAMLSFAIALFLLASIACALAQSMPMLVAARILQGLGGGGLISVSQAIIADVVAPRERGRYQAYISGAFAVASVSGPVVGGLLTEYLSWRWIFWINLPIGLAALLMCRRALALLPVPHVRRPIDYLGAALLICGLTALLVGTTRVGQGISWLAADNLRLFALAAVFLAAFLWQERRAIEPIIPLALFREPAMAISCVVLFVAFFELVSLSVLIPLRLQMVTGMGADTAAFQLVALSLGVPMGAYLSGRMMARTGRYKRFQLLGAALVPAGVAGLALIDPRAAWASMTCMTLTGIGIGFQLPSSLVSAQNAVPVRHIGVATATTAFFRSLGASIGVAVLTAVLLALLREEAPALVAALSGGELVNELVGEALAGMDADGRAQLTRTVQAVFQKIFLIGAAIALIPVVLTLWNPDTALRGHGESASSGEAE